MKELDLHITGIAGSSFSKNLVISPSKTGFGGRDSARASRLILRPLPG